MTTNHDLIAISSSGGLYYAERRCGWRQQRTLKEAATEAHRRHRNLLVHMPALREALDSAKEGSAPHS